MENNLFIKGPHRVSHHCNNPMTERILTLTLEIIYLLTGEDYIVMKKSGDHVSPGSSHHNVSEGFSRTQILRTVSPLRSLIHERNHDQKILELTNQIIHLLTGEVPIRCEDVTVYFSVEEWEYVEGHRDLYKDIITEKHQPLSSLGETSTLTSVPQEESAVVQKTNSKSRTEAKCFRKKNLNKRLCKTLGKVYKSSIFSGSKSEDICTATDYLQRVDACTHIKEKAALSTEKNLPNVPKSSEHPQTDYPSTHIKEEPASCNEGHLTDISTPSEHPQTEYPSIHIKDEAALCEEGNLTDVYGPREHPQGPYTSVHLNGEMVSHQEGSITGMYTRIDPIHVKYTSTYTNEETPCFEGDPPYTDPYEPPGYHYKKATSGEMANITIDIPTPYISTYIKEEPASYEEVCNNIVMHTQAEYASFSSFSDTPSDHELNVQSGNRHVCSACGKDFLYKSKLIRHQRLHTGEKPFACPVCGKCFTQASSLSTHRRRHTGEKPFVCFECGKCYTDNKNLIKHFKIHSQEKMFVCSECGRCFLSVSELVSHQRIHIKEKPFSCSVCGKCFTCKAHVARHQIIHTGERPFSCNNCGKCFARNATLAAHQRIHTGEKPFPCTECGKYFRYKSHFNRHMRIHSRDYRIKSTL
ncbi:oocyte zinc finger protein XlCOF7.1-like [Pelobates fuscus]|uniref:oocyte zinc finger protein XlCOF7.1-like n=1 Tax=Pelobates fuscus TaxID=191477 RepID=UPI002FE4B164